MSLGEEVDKLEALYARLEAGEDVPLLAFLKQYTEVKDRIKAIKFDLVRSARRQGATWQEIADSLGVSRQAAWQTYHKEGGID